MKIFQKKKPRNEALEFAVGDEAKMVSVTHHQYPPALKVVIIAGAAKAKYFRGRGYDFGWEIWGLNSIRPAERLGDHDPWPKIKWARMFNLHRFEHLNRDCPEYIFWDSTWSKANPTVPIYVIDHWHGMLEREEIFTMHALMSLPRGGLYHAGSIDMMVAFAISLGATEIALHGVALATDAAVAEPISARACLEYWCGVAEGRGIKVTCTDDTNIFFQYHLVKSKTVYGYDDVRLIEDRSR